MRVSEGSYEVVLSWGTTPIDVRLLPLSPAPTWRALSQEARMAFVREGQETTPLVVDAAGELRVTHPSEQRTHVMEGEGAVSLHSGAFTLSVRRTTLPPAAKGNVWKDRDFSFFKLATLTGLCSAAVLITLLISPQVDAAQDPFFRKLGHDVLEAFTPPKPPVVPIVKLPPPPIGGDSFERDEQRGGDGTKTRTPGPKVPLHRQGLLGAAADSDGFNRLLSDGDSGFKNALNATDNLKGGPAVVDSGGITGIGVRGREPGVGGGPRGIGRVGTLTPGGGGGGGGPIAFGGERRDTVTLARPPTVVGGLTRLEIQRVISQHATAIRACYETGLSRSPDLEGKVAVQFVIDGTGFVSAARVLETSLDSAVVEGCILQRIGTWRFPSPRGGGEVEVNFPWIFRPAGAQ